MTVCVLGLGQIGLPLALLIAQRRRVIGVDVDEERVDALRSGAVPTDEPDVASLFREVESRFSPRTTVPSADGTSTSADRSTPVDAYVVVTPTPLEEGTRVANLQYVREAVETVAEKLQAGDLVVVMSTVPPGTARRLVLPTLRQSGLDAGEFGFAHCPERAIPGRTVHEMVHNDRVVGAADERSAEATRDLFEFVEGKVYTTDPTTAEFVKLIENTYRDVNIAAANEFARLAEGNGIDCRRAIELANEHPRVDILSPGPGVGGHCLPIDPEFLTQGSADPRLVTTARDINESMPSHVLSLVRDLSGTSADVRLAGLGVAYKGNVADTRKTPALQFYQLARNEGYDVRLHDPHVDAFEHELQPFDAAVSGSDCLVVLADHDEYADLDVERVGSMVRTRAVVDTRGLLRPERWREAGFAVRVLGDGTRAAKRDRERAAASTDR